MSGPGPVNRQGTRQGMALEETGVRLAAMLRRALADRLARRTWDAVAGEVADEPRADARADARVGAGAVGAGPAGDRGDGR